VFDPVHASAVWYTHEQGVAAVANLQENHSADGFTVQTYQYECEQIHLYYRPTGVGISDGASISGRGLGLQPGLYIYILIRYWMAFVTLSVRNRNHFPVV